MKYNLFEDFAPSSKADWIAQVTKDLKGKSFEETLISQAAGNIQIQPFYTQEDIAQALPLEPIHHRVNPISEIPGLSPRRWANTVRIRPLNDKEANARILHALQMGADGLVLALTGEEDLEVLLHEVQPAYIQLYLEPQGDPLELFTKFLTWLKAAELDLNQVYGGLLWDPATVFLKTVQEKSKLMATAKELMKAGKELPEFKVLAIDAAHYHHAGANAVQELAFGIGALIDLIDELTEHGYTASAVFDKLLFTTGVGSDFFLEISKVKVLRLMIHQLCELYGLDVSAAHITIYAQTSYWTKAGKDLDTNMLRNTTEAMAAILGGCNALEILPHDFSDGLDNDFSARMARNISNILKEESYLDKVIDPVSGTYFLEKLSGELFEQVKSKLEKLEVDGGWWMAAEQGRLQQEVKEERQEKQALVRDGVQVKVGLNKYPNPKESSAQLLQEQTETTAQQLLWSRDSLLWETQNSEKS